LTPILMAFIGIAAGFALDAAVARLAREPYERDDDPPAGDAEGQASARHGLELASEAGALAMPSGLTSGARYRTAAVVALSAALFAAVGARYDGNALHVAIVAAYCGVLIICSATDLLAYRVPNVVTYPAILSSFLIGMVMPDANRLDVAIGGLLFGGLLFVPCVITGGAMGMGDVKLAFFVGFALGLTNVVPAMLIMALAGGLAAVGLLVSKRRNRRDPIPYAPFICLGAAWSLLAYGVAFQTL